ncbi:hypothetical protein LIA77_00228 [Sarocladium implicatum]|nr:hypothetical protein LIA77_00228 [Sarocladium implicatum]
MKANLVSLLCLLSAGVASARTDIYVSPTGSDSGDGSQSSPFKSLTKAQQAVRSALGDSSSGAITVRLAGGVHTLTKPLVLTDADSGSSSQPVVWTSSANATISGGLKVTNWKAGSDGIYSASVPSGTYSRDLYVDGVSVPPARKILPRVDFKFNNVGMTWTSSDYDYLQSVRNISKAEVRFINSFTNRIAPIVSISNRQIVFNATNWNNNVVGYDTAPKPFLSRNIYVQGAYDLFSAPGQFFLDTAANTVYYWPLPGQDMSKVGAYIGIQETLLSISGTYDDPAHDITFSGINFAHSTWYRPSLGYGYADQQTGGYLPAIKNYTEFEASRNEWWLMPSAIQVSAAQNINFANGSFTQLGAGGIGIGGDPNAHVSGVGYGASGVSVTGSYFTQVGGNSITAGGIQLDAHHPKDARMINTGISIQENIFYNTSLTYPSTTPILATYVQYSDFTHNDISEVPYSGFCIGYGWGLNDEGGSPAYEQRGTYKFWPIYSTPTTAKNNKVEGNLVRNYGRQMNDFGGIYSLSKSPDTYVLENHMEAQYGYGFYADEGTNSYIYRRNNGFVNTLWFHQNAPPLFTTGNLTLQDNFYNKNVGDDLGFDFPNGKARLNNTYERNYKVNSIQAATVMSGKVAWRAGIPPGKRANRPVSNPNNGPDGGIELEFPTSGNGAVSVRLTNFDDVDFTNLKLTPSITPSTNFTLSTVSAPTSIPANNVAIAQYKVTGSGCIPPTFKISVTYTNPRTGKTTTLTRSNQVVGLGSLDTKANPVATSAKATFGQTCASTDNILGINTIGRDSYNPSDEWAVIKTDNFSTNHGSVSVKVLSIDTSSGKAGIVGRNSLAPYSNSTGHAQVVALASGGVAFRWDARGAGYLTNTTTIANIKTPVCLMLNVDGSYFTPFYSTDCDNWKRFGSPVFVPGRKGYSEFGLIATASNVVQNVTALFTQEF